MSTDNDAAHDRDRTTPRLAGDRSTGVVGGNLSTNAARDRPVGLSGERAGERRARLLVELADAVRDLIEASTVTEYVEVTEFEETVTRRGRRRKSKGRVRRAHHKRLPSLLDQLRYDEPPGTVDLGGATSKGEFESKPPAELATLSVLGEIVDGSRAWAKTLGQPAKGTCEATLSSLVGAAAQADADDVTTLARQMARWVRQARHALRTEAMPITLGDPCPYCWRKNCLVVTGDLASARCTRCGRAWTQDTIGLLASMLQANQQQTTAAAADADEVPAGRCWMRDCIRTGYHGQHADDRGRTWGDACALTG